MGLAIVMEPEQADVFRCRGGAGTLGWPGAYGSWWQADPNDRSVLIFLTHNVLELQQRDRAGARALERPCSYSTMKMSVTTPGAGPSWISAPAMRYDVAFSSAAR